jgi:hypothetical protein
MSKKKKSKIEPVPFSSEDLRLRKVCRPGVTQELLKPRAEFKQHSSPLNLKPSPNLMKKAPRSKGMKCSAAWEVLHTEEEQSLFQKLSEELGNPRTLYHGTPSRNISNIAEEGMKPGRNSCMFGSGIYLGDPDKAFCYCGWGDTAYLLEVKVILGKVCECKQAEKFTLKKLRHAGFDSVAGLAGQTQGMYGALRHSENVIYSPEQALVLAVFEYQKTKVIEYKPRLKSGTCALVRKDHKLLNSMKGNRKYSGFDLDTLAQTLCHTLAVVQVSTPYGSIWVCNDCIRNLDLKVGSKIRIKDPTSYKPNFVDTKISA